MDDEENQEEQETKKESSFLKSFYKNHWAIATIILAVILLLVLFSNITGNTITGNVVSSSTAGQNLINFADAQGVELEILGITDIGNFYELDVSLNGQDTILYLTKDGENLAQLIPIKTSETPQIASQPQDIPKSDKPEIELFIMTHCPYGTQAEKGFIPTIEALGNKINAKIRFVHYFMHEPEKAETPVQICIREEQPDKFLNYLKAFLKEGNTQTALTAAGIDKTALNDCVANRAEQYYAEDSALSEGYGVQGSPTLVINGVQASSGRDSASYLKTICSAFNTEPSECNAVLSSSSPSPGFGYETGSDTGAQC